MHDEHWVRVTVLEVTRDNVQGEPFSTLKSMIDQAWDNVPAKYRREACFKFEIYGLSAWYERPETEEDMRERVEYERLKAKFEKERPA